MLNIFPIQFLAPLAYTILRFCIGIVLLRLGVSEVKKFKTQKTLIITESPVPKGYFVLIFGGLEILSAIFIMLGLYTQIAVLAAICLTIVHMRRYKKYDAGALPQGFFLLLIGALFSLFITGAGAFAFDLPI